MSRREQEWKQPNVHMTLRHLSTIRFMEPIHTANVARLAGPNATFQHLLNAVEHSELQEMSRARDSAVWPRAMVIDGDFVFKPEEMPFPYNGQPWESNYTTHSTLESWKQAMDQWRPQLDDEAIQFWRYLLYSTNFDRNNGIRRDYLDKHTMIDFLTDESQKELYHEYTRSHPWYLLASSIHRQYMRMWMERTRPKMRHPEQYYSS